LHTLRRQGRGQTCADTLVAEIVRNSQAPILSAKQAQNALTIAEIRHGYQVDTGRRVSAVASVTGFVAAAKLLPANAWPVSDEYSDFDETGRALGLMGIARKYSPNVVCNNRSG
jgi:hypothetical protein